MNLHLINKECEHDAYNYIEGNEIHIEVNLPNVHRRKNMAFHKFVKELEYYALMEFICALSQVEGVYCESFCRVYNCKCMQITNKIMEGFK